MNFIAPDEAILKRSTALAATDGIYLQSFDLAVLATVLVWSERVQPSGHALSFCEKDGDLQPWSNKERLPKHPLVDLYDSAGIWVYGDFTKTWPPRREGFP